MQRLRQQLAGESFEILAVNSQEGEPRIRSFLKKVPVTFPIVRDTDGGVTRAWNVRISPSSFVVDRSGAVRHVLIGAMDWSTPEVKRNLRALLPSSRAGATSRQTSPQACVADAHARRAVPRRGPLNRRQYPMQRRALLKAAPAAGTVAAVKLIVACAQAKGWRSFEVSAHLEIAQAKGAVHAWMPLPLSQDTDYFKTLANSCSGNSERAEIVYDPTYRAAMVSAFFKAGEMQPALDVISRFTVRERNVVLKAGAGMLASREEQAPYLKPPELMPTDGIVKKTADEITKGSRADV